MFYQNGDGVSKCAHLFLSLPPFLLGAHCGLHCAKFTTVPPLSGSNLSLSPLAAFADLRGRILKNFGLEVTYTGFSSEIGTKLRESAIGQAGGSCYSRAALSSNDSKTL